MMPCPTVDNKSPKGHGIGANERNKIIAEPVRTNAHGSTNIEADRFISRVLSVLYSAFVFYENSSLQWFPFFWSNALLTLADCLMANIADELIGIMTTITPAASNRGGSTPFNYLRLLSYSYSRLSLLKLQGIPTMLLSAGMDTLRVHIRSARLKRPIKCYNVRAWDTWRTVKTYAKSKDILWSFPRDRKGQIQWAEKII